MTNSSAPQTLKNEQFLTTQWDAAMLGKVLVSGAASVGAVGGVLNEASPASAQIMHFTTPIVATPTITPPATGNRALFPWDIDNDGTADAQLAMGRDPRYGVFFGTTFQSYDIVAAIRGATTGAGAANPFAVQAVLGAGDATVLERLGPGATVERGGLASGALSAAPNFRPLSNFQGWNNTDDNQYFGFTFNPSGTTLLFGWGRLTRQGVASYTLEEWAFDTRGVSIRAGQTVPDPIPEPGTVVGTLAAIAMGGAFAWQQRRKRKAQSGDLTPGQSGMALLAAGAAGIRTWRQEKQQRSAHESDSLDQER